MRSGVRVLGPATVAIAAVLALAWTSPMAAVVHLLTDTAANKTILVMGGTGHPLVDPSPSGKYLFDGLDSYPLAESGLANPEGNAGLLAGYVAGARDKYAIPAVPVGAGGGYNTVAVYTPEEFWQTSDPGYSTSRWTSAWRTWMRASPALAVASHTSIPVAPEPPTNSSCSGTRRAHASPRSRSEI